MDIHITVVCLKHRAVMGSNSGWGEVVFISKPGSLKKPEALVFLLAHFSWAEGGPKFLPQHSHIREAISPASFMTSLHTQKKVPRDLGPLGKNQREFSAPHIST